MASYTTITGEMAAAARGVLALVVGDRKAPDYFDFSQRGLVGSFIAILIVVGIEIALPILLGSRAPGVSAVRTVMSAVIIFASSIGSAALVLRMLGRPDGLVPYVTVINWANFWTGLTGTLLIIFGFPVGILVVAGLLIGLVLQINIARLIVTLPPLQIAMFLIAQLVGVSIGLILVGALLPLSPAELAAIQAASSPPA